MSPASERERLAAALLREFTSAPAETWENTRQSRREGFLRKADALMPLLDEARMEMRETCAVECEDRAVLNDAVEQPNGMCKDEQTGVVATAPGHRAIEARECAFAIRALSLRLDAEEPQP